MFNIPAAEAVKQVASTMAIEQMDLSGDFQQKLMQVAEGKRTTESLRQEIIKKYGF